MKSLTPVAILDNATSKRFLNDEEIRASLPPEGEKVVWCLSNMTIGEGCLVEGAWKSREDGYCVHDELHDDWLSMSEFSHWYKAQ